MPSSGRLEAMVPSDDDCGEMRSSCPPLASASGAVPVEYELGDATSTCNKGAQAQLGVTFPSKLQSLSDQCNTLRGYKVKSCSSYRISQ